MSSNSGCNHTAVLLIKQIGLPLHSCLILLNIPLYMYDCGPNWTPLSDRFSFQIERRFTTKFKQCYGS